MTYKPNRLDASAAEIVLPVSSISEANYLTEPGSQLKTLGTSIGSTRHKDSLTRG